MREPTRRVQSELIVKKSRFIGYGLPAADRDRASSAIAEIKALHSDSSHVVHAFLVGFPFTEIGSMTDAGEPKGTAGRPVMEVLKGSDIRNLVIAVVRYFGGTKLGTGGLVHAYGDSAKSVLDKFARSGTRELVIRDRLEIALAYKFLDPVKRLLSREDAMIEDERFDSDVVLKVLIPRDRCERLSRQVADLTAGAAILHYGENADLNDSTRER